MANKKQNKFLVYHYELMNDFRYILMFEPNVFPDVSSAENHCGILHYLSGQDYNYVIESDISKLDLIKNV